MVGQVDLSDEFESAAMSDGLVKELFGCRDRILGSHHYLR